MIGCQATKRLKHIDARYALSQWMTGHASREQQRVAVRHNQVGVIVDFPEALVVFEQDNMLRIRGGYKRRASAAPSVFNDGFASLVE